MNCVKTIMLHLKHITHGLIRVGILSLAVFIVAKLGGSYFVRQYFFCAWQSVMNHIVDRGAPKNSLVVIGSSTVALWPDSVLPQSIRLGVNGENVLRLTERLKFYKSLNNASAIVLLIGFNDIRVLCDTSKIELSRLRESLPSDVPLIWLAVQGISDEPAKQLCGGNMLKLINQFNLRIELECAKKALCYFLPHPVSTQFTDYERRQFLVHDGIHLSMKGYLQLEIAINNALSLINSKNGIYHE